MRSRASSKKSRREEERGEKRMSKPLAVVLADYDYEDLELHYPRLRLIEEGFDVKIVGSEKKAYVCTLQEMMER